MRFSKRSFILFAFLLSQTLVGQGLMLKFSDTPVEDVIRFVAKETGQNILVTDKIPGKVNFISEKPIEKKDLLDLLRQILQTRGYTIVQDKHGYLLVTRSANAKKMATTKPSEAGMITKNFQVRFIQASDAAQKLRYLLSQFASITFDNKKGIIIVSDYPDRIKEFAEMLRRIDRPIKKAVRYVTLHNTDVKTVLPNLESTFRALKDSYRFPVVIKADSEGNRVVVVADVHDIDNAIEVIRSYDSEEARRQVISDVIFLNNAECKATVKILSGLLKSFDEQTRRKVSFQAKEDINAIVITGTPDAVKTIEKVIHKIDIEPQQVYIKAHIYEISQRKMQKIGVQWGAVMGGINGETLWSAQINPGNGGFKLPSVLQGLIKFDQLEASVALGAVIDFLKQNGAVNVISEPNILTVNNQKSKIHIGKTISILTSTVQGNQSTDLARNTYDREDIGLTLEVKPQIASDNKVLLEVNTVLEDIDQASTTSSDRPTTFKREVKTVAIARDGEQIIIGGLLKDYYSKGENKLPLLGDIPLLGHAFRSESKIKDKVNVLIVLTPFIVKNSQSLSLIQQKVAEIEKLRSDLAHILQRKLKEIPPKSKEKKHSKNRSFRNRNESYDYLHQ